eukprot:8402-Heterococcus_DN1.PRE.1
MPVASACKAYNATLRTAVKCTAHSIQLPILLLVLLRKQPQCKDNVHHCALATCCIAATATGTSDTAAIVKPVYTDQMHD